MSTVPGPPGVAACSGADAPCRKLRVLFFVEGFTDIRFVSGLSEICDLTLAVSGPAFHRDGLADRLAQRSVPITVAEIAGGRLAFQARSFGYLWRRARDFDVILSQEVLRGSLNATVVGALRGVPVVTYMGISPIEYFRCRRERRQIGWFTALAGETIIGVLMRVNGFLATRCVAMGPYLRGVAARYCRRTEIGLYYGVDTEYFRPVDSAERIELRRKCGLPPDRFLIFLSSRISHEKDPETVIRATSLARKQGLDAVLLNASGGYEQFLRLARDLGVPADADWLIGRPAAHPMTEVGDYFRAADVMALASLAEGAAYSTLEALACGTPVVATAVGGMAVQLDGYARLTPRSDPQAMANAFVWVAQHQEEARTQALRGRVYVQREWERRKAFADLNALLQTLANAGPVDP